MSLKFTQTPCVWGGGDLHLKFSQCVSELIVMTHHGFVMKQGLRIHLKSLRPRREIVN